MKRPGRPKLAADDTTASFSLRLPSKQYDATQKQADAARVTMAEWIRRMLAQGLSEHKNRP